MSGARALEAAGPVSAANKLLEWAQRTAPTRISVGCTDWDGRLRLKQLPAASLSKLLADGTAMTTAIFATDTAEVPMDTGLFQDPARGYADARLGFARAAFFPDPLHHSGSDAVVLGELLAPHAMFCPRACALAECDRLAALGFVAQVGFELECHILAETPDRLRTTPPASLRSHPDFVRMYSDVGQALAGPLFDEITRHAHAMDIGLGTLHAEFSGLLEATLSPSTGVQAADRALCLKSIIKTAARRKDALAVFMARLSDVHEPAGMHLNLSLRASVGGDPVFFDTAAGHLSPGPVMAAFLGGLQACLPDLFLLLAPTVNSWKRFQAAAFVPTTNSWGVDNKTAAYRVVLANPRETRVEVRLPGADTHPHLALAAVLAAGRKGIEDQLRPTQAVIGDAHASDAPAGPCFPASFADAITRWRGSRYAREFFGPEFVRAYADSRAWQLQRLERTVTDWEVRQFAECV